MNASWAMDRIRDVFSVIDGAVYSLIAILYELLLKLSRISIFTNQNIDEFSKRVYVFLGIIMLFKVTFSLINYLINPDVIMDKKNGAGNLIKNIIITLALIIFVPYGFDFLYKAQSAILTDNLIPRLILGTEDGNLGEQSIVVDNKICINENGTRYTKSSVGEFIALTTFKPFFQVYNDTEIISKVSDNVKEGICSSSSVKNLLSYRNEDTANWNTGQYIIDYSFFLSTACGVLVLLLLLDFCFDIAMRVIKLGFLEIIAPIPIVSYISPKSSENGMFKKWLKEVMSTWARLFIRLIILFFVVYIIKIVNENLDPLQDNGMWVMLFLIIGALMFAKKAIPLIENILGIKFDHSIQLNPFKKISDQALGGKQLLAAPGKILSTGIGAGTALGGTIAANAKRSKDFINKKNQYTSSMANLDAAQRSLYDANANEQLSRRQAELSRRKSRTAEMYNQTQKEIDALYKKHETEDWTAEDGAKATELFNKRKKIQVMADKYGIDTNSLDDSKVADLYNKAAEDKAKHTQSVNDIKTQQQNVDAETINVDNAKVEMDKQQKANDESWSYNHPGLSGFVQAARGAHQGFTAKDTNNLAHAVTAGIEAAKQATKMRNDHDKYGLWDRLENLKTDIMGVKNESGTTDMLKGELKAQTNMLNNIDNNIRALNNSLSNIEYQQPQAFTYDANGNRKINSNYVFSSPQEKANVEYILDNFNKQIKAKQDMEKAIKETTELMDLRNSKRG